MNTLIQDLRYGIRVLLSKPGFSSIAIVTLALGIAATTSFFSVVDAVMAYWHSRWHSALAKSEFAWRWARGPRMFLGRSCGKV